MKPKAFGSGNITPKFGASKPPGKKPMLGSRRRATGGGIKRMAEGEYVSSDDITPLTPRERAEMNRAARERAFTDAGGIIGGSGADVATLSALGTGAAALAASRFPGVRQGVARLLGQGLSVAEPLRLPAPPPSTAVALRPPNAVALRPPGNPPIPGPQLIKRMMADQEVPDDSATNAPSGPMSLGEQGRPTATPRLSLGEQGLSTAAPSARPRPAARPRGPSAGESEADRLMALYNRPGGVSQERIAQVRDALQKNPNLDVAGLQSLLSEKPMKRGGKVNKDHKFAWEKESGLNRGGKVKKMAIGSQVKLSPEDPQNTFTPGARAKLRAAIRDRSLLGIPEGIKKGGKVRKPLEYSKVDIAQDRKLAEKQNMSMAYGGKVKKMADGGSAGEMQAFMKGRRDARSSMAPKAPMAPKASMAPKAAMSPKARMASKAPMAPKASMPFMKSGGMVKSKSRGNGCAARGHTRGRMV